MSNPWMEILFNLPYEEVLNNCKVNRDLRSICNQDSFWRLYLQRNFNLTHTLPGHNYKFTIDLLSNWYEYLRLITNKPITSTALFYFSSLMLQLGEEIEDLDTLIVNVLRNRQRFDVVALNNLIEELPLVDVDVELVPVQEENNILL